MLRLLSYWFSSGVFAWPQPGKSFWTNRRLRYITNIISFGTGYYLVLHADWSAALGSSGRKHIFSDIQDIYQNHVIKPVCREIIQSITFLKYYFKWKKTEKKTDKEA
mmetsp:Transcript_2834/g.4427  ORF Transcript_2834/g.4427 Transcript_2834/m.4427 type:complete len:107 (+) Transcript_2834:64-384(+)